MVGDDAQAIYSFRAADVQNILGFADQFVPPAKMVTLVTNHRSTAAILDAANAVIALAPTGFKKRMKTPKGARTGPKPALVTVADDRAQARHTTTASAAISSAWRALPLCEGLA